VVRINAAGPLVKVELVTERGQTVQVEISHERYRELQPAKNEMVFVGPREMRVF
jgi:hypothetical protein